jgi:hypothetical protein
MWTELNDELRKQIQEQDPEYVGDPIFELHPAQLYGFMEAVWEMWRRLDEGSLAHSPGLPSPTAAKATVVAFGNVTTTVETDDIRPKFSDVILDLLQSRDSALGPKPDRLQLDVKRAATEVLRQMLRPPATGKPIRTPWLHLMYAYLIENTRAYEILSKVVQGALTGEPFGTLSDTSFRWLRLTEDLFHRDGPSSLVTSITSWLRPDIRATRRNAYHRMFGIDLNPCTADDADYPYVKAAAANTRFVPTLQDLLRELWRGFINSRNQSGPNTTDDGNIREQIRNLKTMMTARRLSSGSARSRANLARVEFVAGATEEWFHLTVNADTSIVTDLNANGDEPEDRLRNLGERVKLPFHGKSRSFFQLAHLVDQDRPTGSLPQFLREIEEGEWDPEGRTGELYNPTIAGNVASRTIDIVNHWSIATGVDLKSVPVAAQSR